MNVAVACGVAVGTAVLTGALLVGDSMQGSLRDLVLAGLGRIDEVLVADHFFREATGRRQVLRQPRGAGDSLFRQPGNGRSGAAGPRGPGQPHRLRRAVLATRQRHPPAPLQARRNRSQRTAGAIAGRERGRLGDAGAAQDRRHPGGKRLRPQAGLGRYHAAEGRPRDSGRRSGPFRPAAQSAGAAERLRFARRFAGATQGARPGQRDPPPDPAARLALASATGRLRHPRRAVAAGLYRRDDRADDLPAGRRAGAAQATRRARRAAGLDLSGQHASPAANWKCPTRPSRRSISRTSRRWAPSFPPTARPCPSWATAKSP